MGRIARSLVLLHLFAAGYGEESSGASHQRCPAAATDGASCDVVIEPPVIDVSALMSSDDHSTAEWNAAAEAVAKACEEWGFFQVKAPSPPIA